MAFEVMYEENLLLLSLIELKFSFTLSLLYTSLIIIFSSSVASGLISSILNGFFFNSEIIESILSKEVITSLELPLRKSDNDFADLLLIKKIN